jgi:hypothetical protein
MSFGQNVVGSFAHSRCDREWVDYVVAVGDRQVLFDRFREWVEHDAAQQLTHRIFDRSSGRPKQYRWMRRLLRSIVCEGTSFNL